MREIKRYKANYSESKIRSDVAECSTKGNYNKIINHPIIKQFIACLSYVFSPPRSITPDIYLHIQGVSLAFGP